MTHFHRIYHPFAISFGANVMFTFNKTTNFYGVARTIQLNVYFYEILYKDTIQIIV